MDRSKPAQHDMSNMKDMSMSDEKQEAGSGAHAINSMEGHLDTGPHMKITAFGQPRRLETPTEAQEVVEAARKAVEKI